MLPEHDLAILRKAHGVLSNYLDPTDSDFVRSLYASKILDQKIVERFKRLKNSHGVEAAAKEFLKKYEENAMSLAPLIDALRAACYQTLVVVLNGNSHDFNDSYLERHLVGILARGQVPHVPQVFAARTELVNDLRRAVMDIGRDENGGCVIVAGMGGIGKTLLAVTVARDPSLYRECYSHTYFIKFPSSDSNQLQTVLLKLYRLTDPTKDATELTVDLLIEKLNVVFLTERPKSLVVLDGISESSLLSNLDLLNCRLLMTTRDVGLGDYLNRRKTVVALSATGFSLNESLDIFCQHLKVQKDSLPPEAIKMHNLCHGHPFLIDLIASLLASENSRSRWKHFCDLVSAGAFQKIRKRSAYDHADFIASIQHSLDLLDNDLKQRYESLCVFPLGARFETKLLILYWKLTSVEVGDIMRQLEHKSMVVVEQRKHEKHLEYVNTVYWIHRLMHRLLKRSVSGDTQREFHRTLVNDYKAVANGAWSQLPLDGYIHRYLSYHLFRGEMRDSLKDVFSDLRFVINKILMDGPEAFLSDLNCYWNYICDDKENDICRQLRSFVTKNLNKNVSNYQTAEGLLQMALFEPKASAVYQKARAIVSSDSEKGSVYYELANDTYAEELEHLNVSWHESKVQQIMWLTDSVVLSAAADKIQVYNLTNSQLVGQMCMNQGCLCLRRIPNSTKILLCNEAGELRKFDLETICPNGLIKFMLLKDAFYDRTPSPLENVEVQELFRSCSRVTKNYSSEDDNGQIDVEQLTTQLSVIDTPTSYRCCSVSKDGLLIACGDSEGKLVVLNVELSNLLHINQFDSAVTSVAFNATDKFLAVVEQSGQLSVTELSNKKCLCHVKDVSAFMWIAGGNFRSCLLLISNQQLNICRYRTGNVVVQWQFETPILTATISDCGTYIAAGFNESLLVWKVENEQLVEIFAQKNCSPVNCLEFNEKANLLMGGFTDGRTKIWKLHNSSSKKDNLFMGQSASIATTSGPISAVVTQSNEFQIVELPKMTNHSSSVSLQNRSLTCIDLRPSGNAAILGFGDGSIKSVVLDRNSNQKLKDLPGHSSEVTCITMSKSGEYFVTGAKDGSLMVWTFDNPAPRILRGHSEKIVKCIFIPESSDRFLITCAVDGAIFVWDLQTNNFTAQTRQKESFTDIDLSRDGKRLASSSQSTSVYLWGMANLDKTATFVHDVFVNVVQFLHSDEILAAGDVSGQVILWSIFDESQLSCINASISPIRFLRFSENGNMLLMASNTLHWCTVDSEGSHAKLQTAPYIIGSSSSIDCLNDFNSIVFVDRRGYLRCLKKVT